MSNMKEKPIEGWIIVSGDGRQTDIHILYKSKADAIMQPHPDSDRRLIKMRETSDGKW